MSQMTEVRTESGTKYQIRKNEDAECYEVRRSAVFGLMRQDKKWIRIYHHEPPQLGKVMVFILEGLGDLPYTERTTTPVVSIKLKDV